MWPFSKKNAIQRYAEKVLISSGLALDLMDIGYSDLLDSPSRMSAEKRLAVGAEFTYVILYTTDYYLMQTLEDDKRLNVMEELTLKCVSLIIDVLLKRSPTEVKRSFFKQFLEDYSNRSEEYCNSDKLHGEGSGSIQANYLYVFGQRVQNAVEDQRLTVGLLSSSLVLRITGGDDCFPGLNLEQFSKEVS